MLRLELSGNGVAIVGGFGVNGTKVVADATTRIGVVNIAENEYDRRV